MGIDGCAILDYRFLGELVAGIKEFTIAYLASHISISSSFCHVSHTYNLH